MIVDGQTRLSDAQALAASGNSTNVIDLALMTPQRDIGVGETIEFNFQVDVAADLASGDETYQFEIIQSTTSGLAAPDTLNQVAIARATLVAGFTFVMKVPEALVTKQFIAVHYTLGGTTPSITITCDVLSEQLSHLAKPQTYAKGYTIS